MSDDKQKMHEIYIENSKFLNEVIFKSSTIALPLVCGAVVTLEINSCSKYVLGFSALLFSLVILFEIVALRRAIEACDAYLSGDDFKKIRSVSIFEKSRFWNHLRDWAFIFSIFLITAALAIYLFNME